MISKITGGADLTKKPNYWSYAVIEALRHVYSVEIIVQRDGDNFFLFEKKPFCELKQVGTASTPDQADNLAYNRALDFARNPDGAKTGEVIDETTRVRPRQLESQVKAGAIG